MKPARKNPLKHLRASDLRGVAQLATQATSGVARVTEGVHQAVWSTLGAPGGATPGTTRGLTGLVYRGVHGITRAVAKSIDLALRGLQPAFESLQSASAETPERAALLAALNGVMGDRLVALGNPLATPMTLRWNGQVLDWNAVPAGWRAGNKVLLLVHGLCMNDLQWHSWRTTDDGRREPGVDHGQALAAELGYTPIYLRYNSGRHTSENGRDLSALLEQLVAAWPTPIEDLSILTHSMGGLVARSALHYGRQDALHWPGQLKNLLFLGTPHHGAPLERAGNWIDLLLGSTPYSAPFARLAQLRSAGITDLRYGHVLDQDWQDRDRFRRTPDRRQHLPLPQGVACFALATTLAAKRSALAERLVGDGLVPLRSALGQHDERARCLTLAPEAQWIGYRINHVQLLSDAAVTRQLLQWLGGVAASPTGPAP